MFDARRLAPPKKISLLHVLTVLIGLGTSRTAAAAPSSLRGVAPAGGGLEAVEASLDPPAGLLRVRRCKAPDCSDSAANGRTFPIPIERSRLDVTGATIAVVPIGDGRSVVHLRIADRERKDLAFEAIVAGQSETPIFAGLTGATHGEDGDRSGPIVLVYDRDGRNKFVIVAESREDTRICGQTATPLGARGLDPKTLELRGATLHRIDKSARDAATRVVAKRGHDVSPLARILDATGGSAPGARSLTDGNAESSWHEQRPGDGHGEFVTMRAPFEVPIHAVSVTITKARATPDGASPRTFFLATDARLFHVTMPEDAWQQPGQAYEIDLPEPVTTSCVSLVLDEAYTNGKTAPEVTVAEITALTAFDRAGATLDDVAKELGGARAEEAAALLRRSGDPGMVAVARRWPELDPRGRALAVDVAASAGTCEGGAIELLTRALADKDGEVKKRALGRIARCGKAAAPSLAIAVRSSDEPRRAQAAPLLAAIAPGAAVEPLGEVIGVGKPETRRAVRAAFARASTSTPRDKLLALIGQKDLAVTARLDLLRAIGARLPELRPDADAALAEILRAGPDLATRWLLVEPLAQLARTTDATTGELTRLADFARRDPDWQVRARAVELAAEIPPLIDTVLAALTDTEPRVREASFRAIAQARRTNTAELIGRVVAHEPWTFVRVAAAEALGALGENAPSQGTLVRLLADPSSKVRGAAVVALGLQRGERSAGAIQERLDDTNEDVEVRALAARALGKLCVRSASDRLTKLAMRSRSPVDEADERLGMAAIEALTLLHPTDLEKRLAPLRGKEVSTLVRRAADRAVAEPGGCR